MNEYYESQAKDAGTEDGAWANQMLAAIEEYFKDINRDCRIVDIGCHTGVGLARLRELGFINLFGIDLIHENIIKLNEKRIPGIALDVHDLSLISDKYFDFVFMSHAIEHTKDPVKVLQEVIRISAEGLIIVPLEPFSTQRVSPPHYYTFKDKQDVLDIIMQANIPEIYWQITPKKRIGEEIWLYYEPLALV